MALLTLNAPNYRNPSLWDTREDVQTRYRVTGQPVIVLTTNVPFVVDGQEYVWKTDLTIGCGGSKLHLMAREDDGLRPAGYIKSLRTHDVGSFSSPESMEIAAAFTQVFMHADETGEWEETYSITRPGAKLVFVPIRPSIPTAG